MSRQINNDGLNLVKQFEGLRLEAYRCPAGVWTIGYGHTHGVKPEATISEEQANHLLAEDLAESGVQVDQCVNVTLIDNQYAALSSFVFNAGIGNLTASTLLKRLNTGDYDCVPRRLSDLSAFKPHIL
jgi:lysozyme